MTDMSHAQNAVPETLAVTLTMTDEIRNNLKQGSGYLDVANAYEINSRDEAQLVIDERNNCLKAIDRLEKLRKAFVAPAQQIIEAAKELFNPGIKGFQASVEVLNAKISDWDKREASRLALEDQQRKEAARKAQQEADRKAAEERARGEEIARQQREKAEAEAKARQQAEERARAAAEAEQRAREAGDKEAQRQAAEAKRKADEEAQARAKSEAKATEQAQAAIDNGSANAQKAQMEAAASFSATIATEEKLTGNTMRDNWIAERKPNVTEDDARNQIAAACVARPELAAFLKLDMAAINRAAKTYKQALNVPGFDAKNDRIAAGSRK